MPIEYFPPACNAVDYLEGYEELTGIVLTTHNLHGRIPYSCRRFQCNRKDYPRAESPFHERLKHYIRFNIWACKKLMMWNPDCILYFEPHSSFPVVLYRSLIKRSVKVFIHYHEYHEQSEIRSPGMRLVRLFHFLEQRLLYPRAKWISQTNDMRLGFFAKDFPFIKKDILHVLPNYPPPHWPSISRNPKESAENPLKCVYVGWLGLDVYYLKEIVLWLKAQQGKIVLDLFCYTASNKTKAFLKAAKCPWIRLIAEGIEYSKIPERLAKYDVGIILHKGNTPNYVYNAPNKLFEYLACGLDVWYPHDMRGIDPYQSNQCLPRVVKVDFRHLDSFDWQTSIHRDGEETTCCVWTYDRVLPALKAAF